MIRPTMSIDPLHASPEFRLGVVPGGEGHSLTKLIEGKMATINKAVLQTGFR